MKYIGVKIVDATPMTSAEFNKYKDRTARPEDVTGDGYLVTYPPDGYQAWCPKDVFDKANRPCDAMPFGFAVEALKQGKRVCRKGWNGKGMWLRHVSPYTDDQFKITETEKAEGTLLDYIGMKTADEGFVPWLASQTDMLADDWMILD